MFNISIDEINKRFIKDKMTCKSEIENNNFIDDFNRDFIDCDIVDEFLILQKVAKSDTDLRYVLRSLGITENKITALIQKQEEMSKFLRIYTINLNELGRSNHKDVVGRENELKLLEIYLGKRNKHNILLVGEPGGR